MGTALSPPGGIIMTHVKIKGKNGLELMEINDDGSVKITKEMEEITSKKNLDQYLNHEKVGSLDKLEVKIVEEEIPEKQAE
jgi:hypothetical protein